MQKCQRLMPHAHASRYFCHRTRICQMSGGFRIHVLETSRPRRLMCRPAVVRQAPVRRVPLGINVALLSPKLNAAKYTRISQQVRAAPIRRAAASSTCCCPGKCQSTSLDVQTFREQHRTPRRRSPPHVDKPYVYDTEEATSS